jgi:hypothetical protein
VQPYIRSAFIACHVCLPVVQAKICANGASKYITWDMYQLIRLEVIKMTCDMVNNYIIFKPSVSQRRLFVTLIITVNRTDVV